MIMSANISPQIFASWIPRGNVAITPQIFASWIPKGEISVKPMIFATYIPAPLAQNLTCDTFRSVEFLSGLASPKLKYKIGNENFSVELFDENKSVFGALALNFGNQKLFAELTETTASNATHTRIKIDGEKYSLANKRLKTIPTFPTLTENIFLYTGNSVSPTFSNFNSSRMILSGETSGTNLGSYNALISPANGYKWRDGTTAAKNFLWRIDVADLGSPSENTDTDISKFADGLNFELADNILRSGSKSYHVNNGTSRAFAKISPQVDGNLIVSCSVSSESGYDFGGITVSSEIFNPTISQLKNKTAFSTGGYIFSGSGSIAQAEYSYPLEGGKTYIIGLHYLKDSSSNANDDRFYLYSVRFEIA